jgi:hypothetical protein
MCYTHVIFATHVKLSDLTTMTNVINMIKINHLDMIMMLFLMM